MMKGYHRPFCVVDPDGNSRRIGPNYLSRCSERAVAVAAVVAAEVAASNLVRRERDWGCYFVVMLCVVLYWKVGGMDYLLVAVVVVVGMTVVVLQRFLRISVFHPATNQDNTHPA